MNLVNNHTSDRAGSPLLRVPRLLAKQTGLINLPYWAWILLLGLLSHAYVGFLPFPQTDDYAYAPLAELAANPDLYPRDDQLLQFSNHAFAYSFVYDLAKATIGVEPGFRLATALIALGAVLALEALIRAVGTDGARPPWAALPLALTIGVFVVSPGIGRGEYGGYVSPFFHHQAISLAFGLAALSACLSGRIMLAGVLLGLAAWAQPATAFHAAFAAGTGLLALGRPGVLLCLRLSAAAALTAAPVVWMTLSSAVDGASTEPQVALNIIDEVYRFRAPHHYDLPVTALALAGLYLALGAVAACLIRRTCRRRGRIALGMLTGFGLLFTICVGPYAIGAPEWLPLFVLDATRSSPLWIIFAAGLVSAAAIPWLPARPSPALNGMLLVLLVGISLVVVVNSTALGFIVLATGAALRIRPDLEELTGRTAVVLLVALTALSLAGHQTRVSLPPAEHDLYSWIRANTASDAMFVTPVGMFQFRLHAKRSVYADFKTFSVSQPRQAELTITRLREIGQPDEKENRLRGWPAMAAWEASQHRYATCDGVRAWMEETGADYVVLYARMRDAQQGARRSCDANALAIAFQNAHYLVFRSQNAGNDLAP